MKLWKKIFLGTIVVFVIFFDLGAYMLASFSYEYNREREIEIGMREQSIILSSVSSSILRAEEFDKNILSKRDRLAIIVKSLSDYYENQGVQLGLVLNSDVIYTNISQIDDDLLEFSDSESKNISDKIVDSKRYLFVSSKIPSFPNLTFIYCRDISNIDSMRKDISEFFVIINIIVIVLMSISIWAILKYLTKPIVLLNRMTTEIANGLYNKRVTIHKSDEIGELAENFNLMAESIESNMVSLQKSAKDKQQFIDDLAHEIKTPITSVIGYSEYLRNTNTSKENQLLALRHLHDSMVRLQNLSNELLRLTLLREEKINLSPVDITDLFDELKITMIPIFEKRNLKLITETEIDSIKGDKTLLLSMLINLVENAARASASNDKVIVRAYYQSSPLIEVIDEGFGMEQEEIEKIREPFYRIDKSRSREFGGAGLGLSIVSRIVILHKAKLVINSEKRKGTTIKVIFTN